MISKRGGDERFKEVYDESANKVVGEKKRVKNEWINGKTYRKIQEIGGLKPGKASMYTVCPHEGESRCCICSEGQGDESQDKRRWLN